jgi:hypothetical protein
MSSETKQGTYKFLSGEGKIDAFHAIQLIALRYKAKLHNPTVNGKGRLYWFTCRDRGAVLNQKTVEFVSAALKAEGLSLPGRPRDTRPPAAEPSGSCT